MEIELVILEVNKAVIVEKLLSFGAVKFFDAVMEQVQYKQNNSLLRVRKEGDKVIFNMKKRVKDSQFKMAEEYEVEVDDYEQMKTILDNLSLNFVRVLKKHRESYKLDGVKFEFDKYLDEYSHVPEFLELEAETKDQLLKWVKKLGFTENQAGSYSTTTILKRYSS